MNIGVVMQVIVTDRINHLTWFLATGRIIQIDQRMPINLLMQDGKICTYRINVQIAHEALPLGKRSSITLVIICFSIEFSIRSITSTANAKVNRLRALTSSSPRERRKNN